MKVLLTGAAGFLGSRLLAVLLEKGYDVVAVFHRRVPPVEHPRLVKVVGDLAEVDIPPADLAVHAAAMTDVDLCEVDRPACWRSNVLATRRVASKMPTIYISTDYVFPGDRGLYKEDDVPSPVNFYGLTKLLGEEAVLARGGWVVRTSGVYGVGGGKKSFPEAVVERLSKGDVISAVADQFYSPTYAGLLAEAIAELLERDRPRVLHVAGPRLSRLEFATAIAEAFGLPKELIKPSKMADMRWVARRPADSSLDVSLAKSLLKTPFWDLGESLNRFKADMGHAAGRR
ncbi:NAD(P)-dependent oxidoreductase [Pyrobaculum sp. 3827-6]|uniref:SDR family oxidoreductase n=1 Tax=Pyrobaculum sp. 3827-6 TaxID=2983604 RepID=UPI0021DA26FF|nr:NAD(P)-dependent oxidoreductase [Pyrobaculum sp. 3827-6]MCU7787760.1 NAD(P)-dependent oxidoreductase [Pyrobaculum sp. 3827-6]